MTGLCKVSIAHIGESRMIRSFIWQVIYLFNVQLVQKNIYDNKTKSNEIFFEK